MQFVHRRLGRFSVLASLLLVLLATLPASAAEKPRLRVEDYVIDATLVPRSHKLIARARVKFTALDELATATFQLHNDLRLTKVTDDAGAPLSAERVTQDSTVRVSLPAGLAKGQTKVLIFQYEGVLQNGDDSPVQGLTLAKVDDDISYLLYAGCWFPMAGYGTNRFTSTISVTVPAGFVVIGSGKESAGKPLALEGELSPAPPALTPSSRSHERRVVSPKREAPAAPVLPGGKTFTFTWDRPSFPGTIIAGRFDQNLVNAGGLNMRVYFKPEHKDLVSTYAETATREFQFFSLQYGMPMSTSVKLVELPNDTLNSAWAPEIAALAGRAISQKVNYRLLANNLAHQWWGVMVSPATRDDWWLSDGFARYSEALYVASLAGEAGYQEAVKDMEVGALAYDTVPLARVSTLDTFSPEFQSLVTDKGAVILHMLRWVVGEEAFDKTLREFAAQFAGKPATIADLEDIVERNAGQRMAWFFAQWLDSTGAPAFKNKYTIFRIRKGFRVVGEISQDLDLFRMPVELRIDTDGRSETKRIEVAGTNSSYSVETFGKPRRIVIDPGNHVLQSSSDLRIRTSILRGQQLVQQGDLAEALREYQKALDANRNSSLAHYRIADVFFLQRNYQAAANAFREALNGDGEPRWVEVWSHIQLGKIFDITGQRERAVNEYRQAVQTNDNTQGAQDEARKYIQSPYQRERPRSVD
jgi:predicted negative regulator of RcsB-dependent stress response